MATLTKLSYGGTAAIVTGMGLIVGFDAATASKATLVGSLTGLDVNASANGNQGVNGTFYVNITSTIVFDRVIARSSQYAFGQGDGGGQAAG